MKNFAVIWKIAWRNVYRSKRRTTLTMLTIISGTVMIVLLNAFAYGGHKQMIVDAVSVSTGHLQLQEMGYWDAQTIDYAFIPDTELINNLRIDSRVKGCASRIQTDGLIIYGDNTSPVMIIGIDADHEKLITNFHERVLPGGTFITAASLKEAVIGETLAKNINAVIGSEISIMSQGFDGSIAAEKLFVAGIVRTGNTDLDRSLLLMNIIQANETFYMEGFINTIVITMKDSNDISKMRDYLLTMVNTDVIDVVTWETMLPELVQFIVMDDWSAYIFDAILFVVVAFGVLNTIQMSVFERTREFGVMLSIGTKPMQIIGMVITESFIISTVGIIIGTTIGYACSYYLYVNPLDYSEYAEEMAVWGINTIVIPAEATMLSLAVTAGVMTILVLVFSWFPARRAATLNPIKAIRQL